PGTHNGMKSVVKELGIQDFPRIRIGIGNSTNEDIVDFVVGKISKSEQDLLDEAAKAAAAAAADIIRNGIDNAMNEHNVTYDN
ncbi:MAG: aminoacyl-tRNA hydrolase, partial [Mogibacterium sp.]|nr:aminoacyl-tRNA hydrolase [Mogibacterium sp.]